MLVVCAAERGLCGPFNTAIVRLTRERANALMAQGKEVKIFDLTSGKELFRLAQSDRPEPDQLVIKLDPTTGENEMADEEWNAGLPACVFMACSSISTTER